jgi:hypothetical protein
MSYLIKYATHSLQYFVADDIRCTKQLNRLIFIFFQYLYPFIINYGAVSILVLDTLK